MIYDSSMLIFLDSKFLAINATYFTKHTITENTTTSRYLEHISLKLTKKLHKTLHFIEIANTLKVVYF